MNILRMSRVPLVICVLLTICGCASRGVRCDDHLLPINAPVAGEGSTLPKDLQ